jgi:hypothetical protein
MLNGSFSPLKIANKLLIRLFFLPILLKINMITWPDPE